MRKILKILAGVICLCSYVHAQSKYAPYPVSQTVQYDDDEPSYHHQPEKYGSVRATSLEPAPIYYRQASSPYPQPHSSFPNSPVRHASYYPQKVELPSEPSSHYQSNEPAYHQQSESGNSHNQNSEKKHDRSSPEDHKAIYEQPEELQYSHEPDENIHKQSIPEPDTSYPPTAPSYQPVQHSNQYPPSAPETSYTKASEPYQPTLSNQQTSLVKRDPRLPLYFTMYEKRIIQDPMDKYGKGPWRYLTYGHGITYGSKEPGKVFEKGYGYIRALGRDHCKLPENQCPPREDKPFEYDGRKEPYFGYRPH